MQLFLISIKICILVIFSIFEKKYNYKSSTCLVIENSISKLYALNLLSKKNHKLNCAVEKKKFLRFKTNLLARLGEKISFQTHTSFNIRYVISIKKSLITIGNLLNDSRKKSYIDLKLSANCLGKILKNQLNKNLNIKEDYLILKAEYFIQIRLLVSGFRILLKMFLFSKPESQIKCHKNSVIDLVEFLKILVYRLALINIQRNKISKSIKNENMNFTNFLILNTSGIECDSFIINDIDIVTTKQLNWVQNRHFKAKIFRSKKLYWNRSSFRKIDLSGWFGHQKFNIVNFLLSFDIFRKRHSDIFFEKLLLNGLKRETDTISVKNF